MRELSVDEIEAVYGGWLTVVMGAVAGGFVNGFNSCLSDGGQSFWSDVGAGVVGGALLGTGAGLAAGSLKVAGQTLKSVTGGASAMGAGGVVQAIQALNDME